MPPILNTPMAWSHVISSPTKPWFRLGAFDIPGNKDGTVEKIFSYYSKSVINNWSLLFGITLLVCKQ